MKIPPLPHTCREALDTAHALIDFTSVRTPRDLCPPIAAWRGRPLHVLVVHLPPCIKGAWLDLTLPAGEGSIDIILLADQATPREQDRALLHELAHMLLGHSAAAGRAKWEQVLRFAAPDQLFTGPAANRSYGQRRPDGAACEQDADIVATSLERALANARRRVPVPGKQHNEPAHDQRHRASSHKYLLITSAVVPRS
jgi:hypothetical protein